jgi:hypothetical protein
MYCHYNIKTLFSLSTEEAGLEWWMLLHSFTFKSNPRCGLVKYLQTQIVFTQHIPYIS